MTKPRGPGAFQANLARYQTRQLFLRRFARFTDADKASLDVRLDLHDFVSPLFFFERFSLSSMRAETPGEMNHAR